MLELVSFICGGAVMVLEMAGARVIAPYLGTSIVVWTAIIGVILASLSLGYWLGGQAGDKNPSARKLGGIILLGAGFVLLAALVHDPLLRIVAGSGMPLQISAVLAALLLFAMPAVFLGMVSPYIIQVKLVLVGNSGKTGAIMGRFFALSTIGSIIGTFLGGYWLISWLGTRTILYGVAATLAIAACLALPRPRKAGAVIVAVACAGLGVYAGFTSSHDLSRGIHFDTRYNHIRIQNGSFERDGRPMRFLVTDPGSVQSGMYIDSPMELALDYTKHYAIGWHLLPEANSFLMLGGGGYSVPKYLLTSRPNAVIDVVEIDPGITKAARDYFALPENSRLRVHHEDARNFLNRNADLKTPPRYDIIMGDTFSSSYNIPFHLGTVECAERIKVLLADNGVFVCNIISAITGEESQVFQGFYHAFAKVFPQTHVIPVNYANRPDITQNIMLVALKAPRAIPLAWDDDMRAILAKEYKQPIPNDIPALTDNYAPVERYAMPLLRKRAM